MVEIQSSVTYMVKDRKSGVDLSSASGVFVPNLTQHVFRGELVDVE